MDKLKQIATDKQRQSNPAWSNIYNTDIRNLFPKYQLSKIQKSKIKYDKFRLMMENIEEFIYLEKHRKQNKMQIGVIDGLKEQLEELQREENKGQQSRDRLEDKGIDKYKNKEQGSAISNTKNYHIDVIKQRDITQSITSQLVKYGKQQSSKTGHKNQILGHTIKTNQKWNNYFTVNTQKPSQISEQQKFIDRIQLAQTAEIPNICDSLNNSTCSLILLERLKKNQVQKALLNKWAHFGKGDGNQNNEDGENSKGKKSETSNLESIGKQFGADWSHQIKDIDFNIYV